MKVLKVDLKNPSVEIIKQAAKVLETGSLVIHPTDTAYGIAGNVFNEDAIRKIYEAKGRDFNKPLIVAIRDLAQAEDLVEFNPQGEKLFKKFFPGPLTIVLPKKPVVPDIVTGGQSLGIRMPNCPVTLTLSSLCSVPYTTTSANPSGLPAPYSIEEILKQFNNETIKQFDLILDAGPLPPTPPSTVVDLTSEKPIILREGPISLEEISLVLI